MAARPARSSEPSRAPRPDRFIAGRLPSCTSTATIRLPSVSEDLRRVEDLRGRGWGSGPKSGRVCDSSPPGPAWPSVWERPLFFALVDFFADFFAFLFDFRGANCSTQPGKTACDMRCRPKHRHRSRGYAPTTSEIQASVQPNGESRARRSHLDAPATPGAWPGTPGTGSVTTSRARHRRVQDARHASRSA